ncbi:MAG TPA: SRPBCC family protein [Thermoanaerobaculia bacterium]|nr:SRPBCC family protein [Thermoanaerobaculia bacterium]
MRVHAFESEIWLPQPRREVFEFFSDAGNLERITPPWVHFRVLTPQPIEMRPGALIDYRLRLRGLPLGWRTLISEWEPPVRFVDLQLRGPYRLWHHTHAFEERDGGTLCADRVLYAVPFDRLVHERLVRPDVERIFAHRRQALAALFGAPETASAS